ncbi:hypothetical protein KR222_010543, partial [Zaprionus bogoriensis]
IIDPNPLIREVMHDFNRVKFEPCTTLRALSRIEFNEGAQRYELKINESRFQWYLDNDLELKAPRPARLNCCYRMVHRSGDQFVEIDDCNEFQQSVLLPNDCDSFVVECRAKGKLIYTNGHATVPERTEIRQRLSYWAERDRQGVAGLVPSVLLIGIDTISRLNLIRAMPETYNYLQSSGWFQMSGYNKIAENTFPNVMALTTGYNHSRVRDKCNPQDFGGLDRCQFIWQLFEQGGYVTAFGEDDVPIHTFNYQKLGFRQQPVDYYMRPYMMAMEDTLARSTQPDLDDQKCLGFVHDSEHIYDYALEFARRYRNDSFFGIFWTNTHSHGRSFSRTSAMDAYMVRYLEKFVAQGTMNHSVVVLLSDHGQRHGPSRSNSLGWLEERLPFLFIWLPPYLRQAHPEFVHALTVNGDRLTNPFDLYITLKNVLALSQRGNVSALGGAKDCARCQSLLQPVPLNRSCDEVAIPRSWCTCWPYRKLKANTGLHLQLAQLVLSYIKKRRSSGCTFCRLDRIMKVL